MARNGSGTFTIPNTHVAGTTITAAALNQNNSDVASELTNSVAADGQTTMTAPLKAASGTVALPGYTFGSDTDSGWYRIGANNLGLALGGSKVLDAAASGIAITGTLSATGTVTFSSTGGVVLPVGTTAQQPTAVAGITRYNSTTSRLEYGNSSTWSVPLIAADLTSQLVKAWGIVTISGGVATLVAGYNVASVNRSAQGRVTITYTTALASANYAAISQLLEQGALVGTQITVETRTTASLATLAVADSTTGNTTPTVTDRDFMFMVIG